MTLRRIGMAAAVLAVGLGTGCEGTQNLLGDSKRTPDEFAVYSRAPLSLPPEYGLRPPEPGSSRPQNVLPRDEARQALLGGRSRRPVAAAPAGASEGTRVLLRQTGALEANPDIRTLINRETSILAEEDKSFTDRILFWGTATEYGSVVDPAQEARRIREKQALGRPLTEDETPTIKRKRRALLEGIFD